MDLRIQQPDDYPVLTVDVDRTKAAQGGYSLRDVGGSLQNLLSGSSQLTPMFFLNYKNGVNYNMVAQAPQYDIQSLNDLQNVPLSSPTAKQPEILADVANISRTTEMQVDQSLQYPPHAGYLWCGAGARSGRGQQRGDRIVAANEKSLPRGTFVRVRGQVETMQSLVPWVCCSVWRLRLCWSIC